MPLRSTRRARWLVPAIALLAGACSDGATGPQQQRPSAAAPPAALLAMECTADVAGSTVSCHEAGSLGGTVRGAIIGGQHVNVSLRSSNLTHVDSVLSFDVTVENLLDEALGTIDGVTLDSAGVRIFFYDGPTASGGGGDLAVRNPDGTATFTGGVQPYFQYSEILQKNDTSAVKRWELTVPPEVTRVTFMVYVAAETQRRVVINEIHPNPGGAVQDSVGEYVEIYNAGRMQTNLKGFILSDNTAGVTDTIKTDLIIPGGGYALLGRSANTSKNGGITPDYLYTGRVGPTATALQFSNSGSDFFRVRAPTGVTVDSVFYSSGTTTAVAGVARELKNPALDNRLVDGANWGAATPFYDASTNRGTPKAQNSNFTS